MKNPTKILVLFVMAVMTLSLAGCVKVVDEEQQYSNASDIEELGIIEEGPGEAEADETAGAAGEDITEDVVDEALSADSSETAEAVPTEGASKIVVTEGQLVEIKPKGYDPDGDKITYTFSSPLDANGKWQTKEGDKGTYNVQVTASDGKSKTTSTLEIVVKEKNRAPVLEPMLDIEVKVGSTVKLEPKVSDPNGDELTLSFSGWMKSAEKETTEEDVGKHDVTVTVSDGDLTDSDSVVITVVPKNHAPVMELIKDIVVNEGDTIKLEPVVEDADGDEVTLAYSGWMTSNEYTTTYDDAGQYSVKITASDGKLETTQSVNIKVEDANRPVQLQLEFEIS